MVIPALGLGGNDRTGPQRAPDHRPEPLTREASYNEILAGHHLRLRKFTLSCWICANPKALYGLTRSSLRTGTVASGRADECAVLASCRGLEWARGLGVGR